MKPFKVLFCLFAFVAAFVAVNLYVEPTVVQYFTDGGAQLATVSPLVAIFAKDLQKNLYPDNEFYKNSKDDSVWVQASKVILPQAGAKPNVEIDRTTLPATITKRTDTAEEYNLAEFTSDPTLLQDTEAMQLSYAKRASILEDHVATINTKVADYFGQAFLPTLAANMVRTSGSSIVATAPGASGNRKALTDADLIKAVTLLDRMDVPMNERYAAITAEMYANLLALDKFVDYQKRGLTDLVAKGWIGEIYGLKIYKRSYLGVYDNTGTPVKKALGAATATTDNEAMLIWQRNAVRRAESGVKVFMDQDKPEYYGSVFSAMVNAGGRIARTDQKGVVAIVQAHA